MAARHGASGKADMGAAGVWGLSSGVWDFPKKKKISYTDIAYMCSPCYYLTRRSASLGIIMYSAAGVRAIGFAPQPETGAGIQPVDWLL